MIVGLIRLPFFHRAYGTLSGPGAEEGEDLERANMISSFVRGVAEASAKIILGARGPPCVWCT